LLPLQKKFVMLDGISASVASEKKLLKHYFAARIMNLFQNIELLDGINFHPGSIWKQALHWQYTRHKSIITIIQKHISLHSVSHAKILIYDRSPSDPCNWINLCVNSDIKTEVWIFL